jgi:Flp pilus assembly protein TadD
MHRGEIKMDNQQTGDRHAEGVKLNNLGATLLQARRFEEAVTACRDAAAIYQKTGDRYGETTVNNLGSG